MQTGYFTVSAAPAGANVAGTLMLVGTLREMVARREESVPDATAFMEYVRERVREKKTHSEPWMLSLHAKRFVKWVQSDLEKEYEFNAVQSMEGDIIAIGEGFERARDRFHF